MREFDTLGFVCTYVLDKAAVAPDRWSSWANHSKTCRRAGRPGYVVTRKSDDEYHEMLELDPDGKGFKPYVTNRFLKVSPSARAQ
jgi:hypothetical protein